MQALAGVACRQLHLSGRQLGRRGRLGRRGQRRGRRGQAVLLAEAAGGLARHGRLAGRRQGEAAGALGCSILGGPAHAPMHAGLRANSIEAPNLNMTLIQATEGAQPHTSPCCFPAIPMGWLIHDSQRE
jgi:hypothetical protein